MPTNNSVLAKIAVLFSADSTKFGPQINTAKKQLDSFGASASSVTSILSSLGLGFGALQVFNIGKDAINSIKDFEHQLSTVKAITGATDEEFKALRKSALALGASTQYTSKQVAELQTEFGRLGFSTQEILNATKATIALATATGEDLAKSAAVVGSTLRSFGLDAQESARVADVMAGAFNRSALGLENFSEAIKYVAPVAAAAGISLEETTALLGILADNGIRGSMAGTSLRKIISDIGGETGTLSEKLQKLADKGLTGADAMDEVGRTAYASLLILTKNTDKTNALAESLKNVAGEAQKTADVMQDNLQGDIVKLSSAYDGFVQSGGAVSGMLREVVQSFTLVLNALNDNNGALGGYIVKWLELATIVPRTVTKVIGGLSDIFSNTASLSNQEVQRAIKVLSEARNKAIAEGNREDELRFTKGIAQLTSMYGLLTDKAVEFKETAATTEIVPEAQLGLIESLEQKIKNVEAAIKKAATVPELRQFQKDLENLNSQLFDLTNPTKRRGTSLLDLRADNETGLFEKVDPGSLLVTIPPIDSSYFEESLERLQESVKNRLAAVREDVIEIDLGGLIANSISQVAEALGEAMVGVGNFGQSALKALINFAKQFGEILIAVGVAALAAKAVIKNPLGAIAAGAALVAIAGAASAALGKAQQNFNNSGGGSAVQSTERFNSSENGQRMIFDGEVEFKLQGNTLVAALNKENTRINRLNG